MRLLLAPALVFIATSLDRGYQTDFWQHLARGRLIAQEHAVVGVDRFTFTAAGQTVYDNNWLSQLTYYGVFRLAGLEGVQAFNSAVLALTFALLFGLCRRVSGSAALAAAAGVLAFFGLWPTFLIRPQTFSMLLFVVLYGLLEASHRRPRLLLCVPPVMALWANVHGGFAVGLALVFAFLLGEGCAYVGATLVSPASRARTEGDTSVAPAGATRQGSQPFALAACLVVSAAATLANPYGWDVYRYAGKLSAVGVARGIEEWLPPSLVSLTGVAGVCSLLILGGLAVTSKHRPSPREVCLLACFAVPACVSVRMTVWWFLAAAPVMARWAAGVARPAGARSDHPSAFAAATAATLIVAAALSLPWFERFHPVMGALRPPHRLESDLQALAERLPEPGPRARLFTRMEWANYFTWSASDRAAVFIEGHVELYPDDTWRRYLAVTQGTGGWEDVIDACAVDYLLLDETYHANLLARVRESGRWSQRARAGPAVLFARRARSDGGRVAEGDF